MNIPGALSLAKTRLARTLALQKCAGAIVSLEGERAREPRIPRIAFVGGLLAVAALGTCVWAEDKPIQCANLIYGGMHTSRCFSDEFLNAAQKQTTVATERRSTAGSSSRTSRPLSSTAPASGS